MAVRVVGVQRAGQATAAPPVPVLPQNPGDQTGVTKVVIENNQPVIAQGGGQSGTATTASRGEPDGLPFDPEALASAIQGTVLPIMGLALSMMAVLLIGWPLARAWARRIDRRTEKALVPAADVVPHIRQLQESVDAMAVELERISEAQRYQARLLSDRTPVLPAREGPRS